MYVYLKTTKKLWKDNTILKARVNKVEDVVSVGDEILVKVTEIDQQGRINLSRKDALPAEEETTEQ